MLLLDKPKFWDRPANKFLLYLNTPLSIVYKYVLSRKYKHKSDVFTIAIGGITAGGAGKTPLAIELAYKLKQSGFNPLIGLKGYGRRSKNATLVDNKISSYHEVGDEALLASKYTNVAVAHDRSDLIRIAKKNSFNIILLDDGLSQRVLRPNLKVLVVDGLQNLGNQLLVPIGPLRMQINYAVNNADLIVFLNEDKYGILDLIKACTDPCKIIRASTKVDLSNVKKNVVLFSGLGCNQKFFDRFSDFNVIKTFSFPDHYPYSSNDIKDIKNFTKKMQIEINEDIDIVTTEKDKMRIPVWMSSGIKTVKINVEFDAAEIIKNIGALNE